MNQEMYEVIKNQPGFIAALDQSGGSSAKTLTQYGISEKEYHSEAEMFDLIHQMRQRVFTSPVFTHEKIIGAILFEKTMLAKVGHEFTADYLWREKRIVPFLKIDQGLQEEKNGVKLMKDVPDLLATLSEAKAKNIFGTKMRSVIFAANQQGIEAIVEQQFAWAKIICGQDLVPIIEPEVDIHAPEKNQCEQLLKQAIKKRLTDWPQDAKIMFKFTLPTETDFYLDLYDYGCVLRIVALSGGYSLAKAVALLQQNHKMSASFSRALLADLNVNQTAEEFDQKLKDVIAKIYDASIT